MHPSIPPCIRPSGLVRLVWLVGLVGLAGWFGWFGWFGCLFAGGGSLMIDRFRYAGSLLAEQINNKNTLTDQ